MDLSVVRLVYVGAKLYDPVVGRMLSADPTVRIATHSQNLNRYRWVRVLRAAARDSTQSPVATSCNTAT
jgi:hypothetical protein